MMQFCMISLKSRQKRTIRGKSDQFFFVQFYLLAPADSYNWSHCGSRYRKKRVSFNHRLRKGLTLDSDRERPDQHEVVLRVANSELWYTFQNTVTAFLSRCKRG